MEVVSKLAGDSWQCVKGKQSLCDARCVHKNRAVPKYEIRNKNTEDRCPAGTTTWTYISSTQATLQ